MDFLFIVMYLLYYHFIIIIYKHKCKYKYILSFPTPHVTHKLANKLTTYLSTYSELSTHPYALTHPNDPLPYPNPIHPSNHPRLSIFPTPSKKRQKKKCRWQDNQGVTGYKNLSIHFSLRFALLFFDSFLPFHSSLTIHTYIHTNSRNEAKLNSEPHFSGFKHITLHYLSIYLTLIFLSNRNHRIVYLLSTPIVYHINSYLSSHYPQPHPDNRPSRIEIIRYVYKPCSEYSSWCCCGSLRECKTNMAS